LDNPRPNLGEGRVLGAGIICLYWSWSQSQRQHQLQQAALAPWYPIQLVVWPLPHRSSDDGLDPTPDIEIPHHLHPRRLNRRVQVIKNAVYCSLVKNR